MHSLKANSASLWSLKLYKKGNLMLVLPGCYRLGDWFSPCSHFSQSLCVAFMGHVLVLCKLGCPWLSSSPNPSSKVITCRPSWGSVLLLAMINSSVKTFCLAQSLLSCCKFRFHNFWCFAGLLQLMSQFSWEFFAAFSVFSSFSQWLIKLVFVAHKLSWVFGL